MLQVTYIGMAAHRDNTTADYSDWMKSLPEPLYSMPMNHLAIPGIGMLLAV